MQYYAIFCAVSQVNINGAHHSDEYYTNPESFDPGRKRYYFKIFTDRERGGEREREGRVQEREIKKGRGREIEAGRCKGREKDTLF